MKNYFKNAIVCVDDDPMILQVLSFQIEKHINTSETLTEYFSDPEVALEHLNAIKAEGIPVACAIIDYQMPKLTGAQLIRKMKELDNATGFIMLSGQANAVQIDSLIEEKLLCKFIAKPWNEKELFDAINELIV